MVSSVTVSGRGLNLSSFTGQESDSDVPLGMQPQQGSDSSSSGNAGDSSEESQRKEYTMPGVLHYLQHAWTKFECERSAWELERAELQARISFLNGERRGQENLKNDLVRRIKMLEYSLKQERAKNYRLTHNGQEPPDPLEEEHEDLEAQNAPLDIDAYTDRSEAVDGWKNGRQLLKKYLEEIGYSETILDVRSFRVKNLLGLMGDKQWDEDSDGGRKNLNETRIRRGDNDSDDDVGMSKSGKNLDLETVEALDEFNFLSSESDAKSSKQSKGDGWNVDQNQIAMMKENFKSEQERKRSNSSSESTAYAKTGGGLSTLQMLGMGGDGKADEDNLAKGSRRVRVSGNEFDLNSVLGLAGGDGEGDVDIKDDFATNLNDDNSAVSISWNLKFTLRSHLDSIRAMQFHPVEPVLITASEDGTAKLWNLAARPHAEGKNQGSAATELEPVYTFRGHSGPILCMDMSPTGDILYTAGVDGAICCWNVPSVNTDTYYDTYDPSILQERLLGHTDAVWSIAFHSSDNKLLSASADGNLIVWEPGSSNVLVKTIAPPQPGMRPRSVDFVSTDPQLFLAAYDKAYAAIMDIESGETIMKFDFGEDSAAITKILSHPTMPVTITAGDDRKIRYFDNTTGQLIHGTVAHVEAISSLAIDPNGLYLLSGSHDGSLRMWNMEKRVCLQEIAAHRKKYDMAVLSVAFHPSRSLIGSAGADGLAKVFGSQRLQQLDS
ncbi:hypothetical protein QR680_004354 [Steinernema hermaphroditum]|uniref:Striatin N-terminal domain-containing protein n=1 Tax=Steinernema hermaphroditum TaxID=289476 RepID=A0AA39LTJ2_9BILA|nr:hypothetical protein QR680_004354 [Steinernema hermaphroditum]